MSGDIQARKRKEKKRKKDEEDNVTPSPVVGNVSENLTDNVTIHIYKESTTGGHWCARIIFFAVLTMLVGLIGVVIIEHRGTTEISTPLESSRWAFIFDGWVDDSLSLSNEESYDNENENIEQVEDERNYDEDNGKIETTESEAFNEKEDETLNEYAEEDKETIENESNEEQSDILEDEEELSNENEYESRKQITLEDNDSTFDETNVLEEIYGISTEKDSDEKSVLNEVDTQFDRILEMPRNEDIFGEYLDISGVKEISDDNIKPLEEVESIESEEYVNDVDVKPEIEEIEEESAGVAMKFGVGVALIVTAHFVLVKRWNNGKYEKEVQDTIGNKVETKKYKKEEEDIEIEEQVDVQKNDEIEEKEKREEEKEVQEEEEGEGGEEQENGGEEEGWEEEDTGEEEEEEEGEEQEEEEEEEEKVKNRQKQDDKEKKTEILGIEDGKEENKNKRWDKKNNKNGNNSNKIKQKNEMEIVQKMLKGEEQTDEEIENFDDSELIAKLEAKYGKL